MEFHGNFTSADASALTETNSRVSLFKADSTAITLGTTDWVIVTDVAINTGAAITTTVYDGADATPAAAETIAKVTINGINVQSYITGHTCTVGTYPKVKTSAIGQVDVQLKGYIMTITP